MWRWWCWHWYLRGSWQGRWRSQPGWWSWGGRRWQWWRARRGSGRSDSPWAEQCWWAKGKLGKISSTLIWMILMTRKVWCFWEFQPDGSIPFRVFPSEVGHAENGKPNWHLNVSRGLSDIIVSDHYAFCWHQHHFQLKIWGIYYTTYGGGGHKDCSPRWQIQWTRSAWGCWKRSSRQEREEPADQKVKVIQS